MNPYYTDYSDFLKKIFPGIKVQKISLNVGLSCPNRDGTLGRGGCIYCNNQTFNPEYCNSTINVSEQIEIGKRFFSSKYPAMKFLAYFQAYTNTYGSIERLLSLYNEALSVDDVVGLIIGTRPDCIGNELLGELVKINNTHPVIVELGAETSNNNTLKLINRGHTWEQTVDAVMRIHSAGLSVGLHLIAGLPGETADDILKTIEDVVALPIDTLKIHQLQIVKGTILAAMISQDKMSVEHFSVDDYVDLCANMVSKIPKHIAIERFVSQSPDELLISPRWGLKNYQFVNKLHNRLKQINKKI